MDEAQAMALAIEEIGGGEPDFTADDVGLDLSVGHSGYGWYAWSAEYPEEGSIFLGSP